MSIMKGDLQSQFFSWLARSVSPAQLSEIYEAFINLQNALTDNIYLHHLNQPLMETTDAAAVDQLYNDLRKNKYFMRSYGSGLKLSLIKHYARYCRENEPAGKSEPAKEYASSGDVLIDRLKKEAIPYIDNRSKNGALWIDRSPKADAIVNDATAQGLHFVYSAFKQQWWTRDPSPKAANEHFEYSANMEKKTREAFFQWLKSEITDPVDLFSVYGTIRKIHMLLQKSSELGLFGVPGSQNVQNTLSKVQLMREFITGDKIEKGLWSQSIQYYLRYIQSLENTAESNKSAFAAPTTATEISTNFREAVKDKATSATPNTATEISTDPREAARDKAAFATSNAATEISTNSRGTGKDNFSRMPITNTAYTSEEGLRQWLENKHNSANAESIISAIHDAEKFAQRSHLHGIRFFKVSSSAAFISVKRLLSNKAFFKDCPQSYQNIRQSLELLMAYLDSFNAAAHEKANVSQDNPPAKPVPSTSVISKGSQPSFEPSLENLLQDDMFSELRKALFDQGIHTMDDFCKLNLWIFLNQKSLYSIGQRQTVYSTIRKALKNNTTNGSTSLWRLKTTNSEYKGSSPAEVLMEYCRAMALKYPLRIRELIGQRYNGSGSIVLMRTRGSSDDPKMDNPEAYINIKTSAEAALIYGRWICMVCRDNDKLLSIQNITPSLPRKEIDDKPQSNPLSPQSNNTNSIVREPASSVATVPKASVPSATIPTMPKSEPVVSQSKGTVSLFSGIVEKLVLASDLSGISITEIMNKVPAISWAELKGIRDFSPKLVDMGDRLIHVNAFVDWEEGANKLSEILEKLLSKNNGYVSSNQLFEYTRAEMQMFLNDNDIANEHCVFCISRHLFEKVGWAGKHYAFSANGHISRGGKETLQSNMDVIRKFARDHNGFFRYDDLVAYLEQVGIKTGNLRGQMQLGSKPAFFYYSSDEIISAESMQINDAWLKQASRAFARLFADVGDHVIFRSIIPIWYEQLPTLPGSLPWTPLLLQYILQFYGDRLGAKTIGSELNQKYDVLHAMLVTPDSEIQTFADAVVAYLVDSEISDRQFEAEALRGKLVEGGLIAGNELIWNMPKAIGADPRFAWDASGEIVNIKV